MAGTLPLYNKILGLGSQGGQGGCGDHGFVSLYLVFLQLRWFGLVEFGLVWLSLVWFGQVCFGLVIPQTNKQIK